MEYADKFYSVIGTIIRTMWMNDIGTDMRLIDQNYADSIVSLIYAC